MQESVSGLKEIGTWDEVVAHGNQVSRALKSHNVPTTHPDAFEEFENWRPKEGETLEEDVMDRTIEQAETGKGPGEQKGAPATDDFKTAGKRVKEAPAKAVDSGEAASKSLFSTIIHTLRGLDTLIRQTFRGMERPVYRNVMVMTCPQYFDNELVSANLDEKRLFKNPDESTYVLEIKINDDDLRDDVRDDVR